MTVSDLSDVLAHMNPGAKVCCRLRGQYNPFAPPEADLETDETDDVGEPMFKNTAVLELDDPT